MAGASIALFGGLGCFFDNNPCPPTGFLIAGVGVAATPIIIDAATGAWFRLEPDAVFVGFE